MKLRAKLHFLWEELKGAYRVGKTGEKVVGHSTLAAVVVIGSEESARIWEERLGRPKGSLSAGDKLDLGVISEGEITMKTGVSHG